MTKTQWIMCAVGVLVLVGAVAGITVCGVSLYIGQGLVG
jgi:hypothetical protein